MKEKFISISALCALIFVVAVVVFSSCEKVVFSDDIEGTGDKNGNLRVSVFQIEKTAFEAFTRAAASEACTRLNFAVYNMDGSRVKQVNQTSDKSGFGTASFQLDEGKYLLVVLGHSASSNPTMTNPAKIQFTNATGYTDTFLHSEEITIGEEPVDMQVALDRIVSLCRVIITDDYPEGVAKMQFYYTGGSGAFDASTGYGSVNSKQTVTFSVTEGQKQFDLYTFLHEDSDNISLKITALDASGNELKTRDFDVQMERNKITWLTGAFFEGGGSSSSIAVTGVTVNTEWAGDLRQNF